VTKTARVLGQLAFGKLTVCAVFTLPADHAKLPADGRGPSKQAWGDPPFATWWRCWHRAPLVGRGRRRPGGQAATEQQGRPATERARRFAHHERAPASNGGAPALRQSPHRRRRQRGAHVGAWLQPALST